MANPLFKMFMGQMGQDVSMFDQLASMLLGNNTQEQEQPQQQPQQTGTPFFPTPPGAVMPMPNGAPATTWAPPDPSMMGYQQGASDRPTAITGRIYQGMIDRGIPPHIAAGFMENAKDESGFRLDAVGDNGNAKGIFQWNGPRKRQFEQIFGDDWSLDNQLDFLKWELNNTEKGAWQKIQQARTPNEAAALILNHFERPAEEHRARREAKYLGGEGGTWSMGSMGGPEDTIDYSALEEAMQEEDEEPGLRTRANAFFKGLGQLSQGETIDVSDVFEQFRDRQEEARKRAQELASLGINEQMAQRERRWDLQDTALSQQHDFDLKQMDIDTKEAERLRVRESTKAALQMIYPDNETASELADIDPEVAMKYASAQEEKQLKAAEQEKELQDRQSQAEVYRQRGFEDIAQIALTDPIGARDMYKERTGVSDAFLDSQILAQGGPAADALAQRLRLEAGSTDPRMKGIIDNEITELGRLDEAQTKSRTRQAQMRYALELASDETLDQGKFQEALLGIRGYLADAYNLDTTQLSKQQLFKSVNEGLVSQMRVEGDIMSDQDVIRYRDSVSRLGNTQAANVATLQAQLENDRRENLYINARRKYFNDPNNDLADGNARDAFIKAELEKQDATGDIFLNLADTSEDNIQRVGRALERGDLKPNTAVFVKGDDGQTKIVILNEKAIADLKQAYGK